MLRGIFRQEDYARLAGERLNVGRVSQPSRANISPDHFGKVFLVEGHLALGHFHHARAIGMATDYRGSKIRQTGRNHRPQIPRPINADLHASSPGWKQLCPSYLLFTLLIAAGAEYERDMYFAKQYRCGTCNQNSLLETRHS